MLYLLGGEYLFERGHQVCGEEPGIHRKPAVFHNRTLGKRNPTSALPALEFSTAI
jgi:hypothetical protein